MVFCSTFCSNCRHYILELRVELVDPDLEEIMVRSNISHFPEVADEMMNMKLVKMFQKMVEILLAKMPSVNKSLISQRVFEDFFIKSYIEVSYTYYKCDTRNIHFRKL